MQRVFVGLEIHARTNDGTAYSKSRVRAIITMLENEGFTVKAERRLHIAIREKEENEKPQEELYSG